LEESRVRFASFQEDFYEFMLFDDDGLTLNEKMIQQQVADPVNHEIPLCLSYPSFHMLEKLATYTTFGERFSLQKIHGVNFNEFEEKNIPQLVNAESFEKELEKLLNDERFFGIRKALEKLHG
jgi:hypothetical protein